MTELYRDHPELYDLLHDGEIADLGFFTAIAGAIAPPGASVLELGCGSGRVMEALLEQGLRVAGLDAEDAMLQRARRRLARFGTQARLIHGDMRRLELGSERFDLVVVAVNTFMHLQDHHEQRACLTGVRDHLAAGGAAVLDVANPFHTMALPQGMVTLRKQARDSATGETVTVTGVLEVDLTGPRAVDRLMFDRWGDDGIVRRLSSTVELRLLFMPELELLLTASNLGIGDAYGDYDLGPYHAGAERMISIIRAYDG